MAKDALITELQAICGKDGVLHRPSELLVYDCDAFTVARATPDVVVLPTSTEQVQAVVRLAATHQLPIVPRGAGTGLSGGALATGGIMLSLTRMRRILDLDPRNRQATVEAGLVNLQLSQNVRSYGLHYAPDPSSQMACTIGGNIAENSGGPHTLKYGVTTNHVLAIELVGADGEAVWLGHPVEDPGGLDLVGVTVGSEGTFGIVTKAVVRLTPLPSSVRTMLAVFESVDDACQAVSSIIGAGIVPAALEMMDRLIIEAVEAAFSFGFPTDAEAVLIIELDGLEAGLSSQADRVIRHCYEHQAREVRLASDETERSRLWAARKRAIGAVGRLAPSKVTQDGVIPRTKLPETLRAIAEIGSRYALRIANVFHAGDGNLHPIVLFDERDPEQVARVMQAGSEILRVCAELGGSISGEHGVGIEKLEHMSLIFSEDDMHAMLRVRRAFDPEGRFNPGKVLPTGLGCGEARRPAGGPS